MTAIEIWSYREDPWRGLAIGGFSVEASDGKIGKVDEVSTELNGSYIVVDTAGAWPGGKKALLPAGVVEAIDVYDRKVYVDRTKDEIQNAPEFDKERYREAVWREKLGGYYTRKDSKVA
jgi:hypothetical protein